MRSLLPILCLLPLCCPVAADDIQRSREQIEKDLTLQITLLSPATIQVGEDIRVKMLVSNQSHDTPYPLVPAGDGSDVGMREPYIYFTATIDTGDGHAKAVPKTDYIRDCGLFAANWPKDALVLKPGEEMALERWFASPSEALEFQQAGRVRLFAHYVYRAGHTKPALAERAAVTGLMVGVPAFELVSAPVEFDVVRTLDLVITAKAPLPVKTKTKISDLMDVQLVNRSDQAMEVSSPTLSADARLYLEIQGKYRGWRPSLGTQDSTYGQKITLAPGEKVTVLGPGVFANGLDGTWEYPVPDTVKVRARFHVSTRTPASVIYSNWIEIQAVGAEDLAP